LEKTGTKFVGVKRWEKGWGMFSTEGELQALYSGRK
jgi:hypothetical protein